MTIRIPDELRPLCRPLAWIKSNPANVNQHDDKSLAEIAGSFTEFGVDQPVITNAKGVLIAGHGRIEAARQLGMTEYPVVVNDLSSLDATRRMLGDNRIPSFAHADDMALGELLRQLQAEDALAGTGYDDGAVDALLAALTQATDDEWGAAMGGLPSGDKAPFEQMTFTLSTGQAGTVRDALGAAKTAGAFEETGNENNNGNALARICEAYLNG